MKSIAIHEGQDVVGQTLKERGQAFEDELRRLCRRFNLTIRGQVPAETLLVYDTAELHKRGSHALYNPSCFHRVDVRDF